MRSDPTPPLSVPAGRLLIALLAAAVASVSLSAQTTEPGTEPEAPATLLPFKIGDASVDLSIAGSWTAQTSFGAGLLFGPGESVQAVDSLPGIATGFAFSQIPDLSLSITLLERWFIEVSVLAGFSDNSLLMGYRGGGNEPVRHVLFGNSGITATPSPFLEIPDQAEGSLGISALVAAGVGTNEALLRWDVTGEQHRTYLGANELLEERIGLDEWMRGRFFVLPDADVENLVVLLEDEEGMLVADDPPAGDSRRYRQAGFDDVIVDAKAGRVTLRTERKGRVLVHYTKNGKPVGDATLGIGALPEDAGGNRRKISASDDFYWGMGSYLGMDMDARAIVVSGKTYLMLWEPGDPSPFQAANVYAYSIAATVEASRLTAFLEKKTQLSAPPQDIGYSFDASNKRAMLFVDRDFRADFRNWYPFHTDTPLDDINLLYGPDRDALAGVIDFDLVVQALQPVEAYVLGSDVLPGSVRVTVNGVDERRFTFDKSTGRITFQVEIASSDRIEVRWRTADAGSSGGDVLLTWRNDIQLAEHLGLWVAAGLRWNVGTGLTAGEPYARSGAVVAAAGIEGSAGNLAWSVEAAGSYMNPDTTGVVRLHGMEGHSIEVDLSEERAWPAAPPDPSGPLSAFTKANRGRLLYKDYRSYDAFGGAQLHAIEWPEAAAIPYDNGGRPGPYNVLGTSTSSSSGRSLVLDYDLPAVGDWVGTQLPVVPGSFADLSTAKSVTLRMKGTEAAGNVRVHLEVGAVGEDLDGDGVLDAEASATSLGFPFDDTGNSAVLNVGAGPRQQGNRVLDSEDRDGSGTLTPEDPARIFADWTDAVDGTWRTFTFTLDDADRARLQQARSIRLIVERQVAGATGSILIDQVSVAGSGYWAESSTGTVTVREVSEQLLGADDPLEEINPEAVDLFHPAGETQEVLMMDWSVASTDVELTGYSAKTTSGIVYDTAAVYVRGKGILPASGVTIDFSLLDSAGKGITWTIDADRLPADAWRKLSVSSTAATITLGDEDLPGTPTFDDGHGELSLLKVVIHNSTDGTLYLDEVHLSDPRSSLGAALKAEVSWSRPGVIWKAGTVPLLANASVDQKLSLATAGFTSLYGTPIEQGEITSSTNVSADILYTRLQADIVLHDVEGEFASRGGHRLTIPATSSPVTFSDEFTLAGPGEFSRQNSLRIQPFDVLAVALDAKADESGEVLVREWATSVAARPLDGLSLALDLGFSQDSTGYSLPDTWYGDRWWEATKVLALGSAGTAFERAEYLSADVEATIWSLNAGMSIDASATSTDIDPTGLTRDQEDTIDMAWSVGWPAGGGRDDGLTVTLRYDRSLTLEGAGDGVDPFIAEAGTFFSRLGKQTFFLLGLPLVEILLDDTGEVDGLWDQLGIDEAEWKPSLSVLVERRSGSRLADLFVPAAAELSVTRTLQKLSDLSGNEILIKPRLVTRALNLFGRLGSHPIMPFYQTDEFSIVLSGEVSGPRLVELSLSTLALELYADILGFKDQSLTLVNVFSLETEDTSAKNGLEAVFDWTTRPADGVRLPYLPASVAHTGYFEHRETLDLDLLFGGVSASHPLTMLLGHSTSLVYPDRGTIKAGLKVGFDVEALAGSFAYRFAIEAGLEAKLSF